MAKLGYRRVSTVEQKTDRQELPPDIDQDDIYEEKTSGKSRKERPELAAMLKRTRAGDEVFVWSIDRLARSLRDLTDIVDEIANRGASVCFIKEGLTFSSAETDFAGRLMFQVLGAIAEFERALILQRQREGIEKAKKAGRYQGRPPADNRAEIHQMFKSGLRPAHVAKLANIHLSTAYRIRKQLFEAPTLPR